jgi:hypothetical protein
MQRHLAPAVYCACGVAFLIASSSAHYLAMFVVMALLGVMLIGLLHVAVLLIFLIIAVVLKRPVRIAARLPTIFSVLFLALCLLLGSALARILIAETQRRGDEALVEIARFQRDEGRCPTAFAEMEAFADSPPRPALLSSEFRLSAKLGECRLEFDAGALVICKKSATRQEWYCDS